MSTLFLGVALSVLVCQIHALITRRFDLAVGGAPLLAVFLLLGLALGGVN